MNLTSRVGVANGHYKTKENRAQKLINVWDSLRSKFTDMANRGHGETETARLAYAVLVMMETGIRVGNEPSAEGFICENKWSPHFGKPIKTYGLTTLLGRHVSIRRGKLILSFLGKKAVEQNLETAYPALLLNCPAAGPDDKWLGLDYYTLKKFVKRYVGRQFTPKDLRIARVNLTFCDLFERDHAGEHATATTKTGRKKAVAACVERTAAKIGHTKSVCRSAYLSRSLIGYLSE